MKRTTTIALVGALVVALAAMPLGAASVDTGVQAETDAEDADAVAPGERLSGVVAVQNAEVEGEVAERTYGIKIAQAATDEAKADVVNEQLGDVEDRLDDLEQRSAELEEARDDGEITEGQYRAEVATVAAEQATVERMVEDANATAGELPDQEIDTDAIEELRDRANELTGPEVAEIAQSIAGDRVGQTTAPDREPGAPIDVPGTEQDRPDDDDAAGGPPADDDDEDDDQAESPGSESADDPETTDTGGSDN